MSKITKGKWSAFRKPTYEIEDGCTLISTGHDPDRWVLKSEIDHDGGEPIVRTTIHFGEIYRCGQMPDEELEANASAIAALPDLIEAAEPFADPVNEVGMGESSDERDVEIIVKAGQLRALRSALLKAKGEAGQ